MITLKNDELNRIQEAVRRVYRHFKCYTVVGREPKVCKCHDHDTFVKVRVTLHGEDEDKSEGHLILVCPSCGYTR